MEFGNPCWAVFERSLQLMSGGSCVKIFLKGSKVVLKRDKTAQRDLPQSSQYFPDRLQAT